MIWLSKQTIKTDLTSIIGKGSDLVRLLSLFALKLRNFSWEFIRTAESPNAGMPILLSLSCIAAGQENFASVTIFQMSLT